MKTAFPQFRTPVDIRLYKNIPFDNTYANHCLLSQEFNYNGSPIGLDDRDLPTGGLKEMFINRRNWELTPAPYYYRRYDISGDFNFNYANGLITSVVLELTPEQTNANYMRVKNPLQGLSGGVYYYFITGITQVNYDTYKLSLELDVLMTYQDEFLKGMKNVPVFTERKHCHRYADNGLTPMCADLKTGEDIFAGVKPSIISDMETLEYANGGVAKIKDVVWLYICSDGEVGSDGNRDFLSSFDGIQYPFSMLALPINVGSLVIKAPDNSTLVTFTQDDIKTCIVKHLIGSGAMHGAKLSYMPPFASPTASSITYSGGTLTLKASAVTTQWGSLPNYDLVTIGRNNFVVCVSPAGLHGDFFMSTTLGCMVISSFTTKFYGYSSVDILNYGFDNTTSPTPLLDRYTDPKLLFEPFRKYVLCSPYNSDGWEFYPELLFSEYALSSSYGMFKFATMFTPYIEDNNYYTTLEPSYIDGTNYAYENYKYAKVGATSNTNYRMPIGTNALDVFNATQAQSFYTSKVASGISAGLTIAGGAGSIALGVAGLAGSLGLSAPASIGLVAGGITGVAHGITGTATAIKSTTAKIEDLKNTPDSVNLGGSNFISDNAIMGSKDKVPFVMIYDTSSVIKQKANDFFYNYGYQVARECYFNTDLHYTATNKTTDDDLFGRTIFNYIKLQEDITNKINIDMPIIIKQKLSKIFNDGITLWSFFGMAELWYGNSVYDAQYNIDKWFMKCKLDNTECNLSLQ